MLMTAFAPQLLPALAPFAFFLFNPFPALAFFSFALALFIGAVIPPIAALYIVVEPPPFLRMRILLATLLGLGGPGQQQRG